MNWKQIALLVVLLAAAGWVAHWRTSGFQKARKESPLSERLTFDYKGSVKGLFAMLTEKSGARYEVDPSIAQTEVVISAKNLSVVQIQDQAANKAELRYRPPAEGSDAIRVGPKKVAE